MPNTAVDIIVILVILISAVLAFVRGFIRESLALGTWLIATYLSFTQFHRVIPFLEDKISNPMLRDFAAGVVVFALVMLVLIPISFYIRSFVKGEQITAVDRSFGFLFGAARGFLLLSIFYLIGSWLMPDEKQPEWMKDAKTKPVLAYGADLIRGVIPEEQRKMLEKKGADMKEAQDKANSAPATATKDIAAPAPETDQFDQVIGDVKKGP